MSDDWWLENVAKKRGITVEELRQEMKDRGRKGGKRQAELGGGLKDPKTRKKAHKRSIEVRRKKDVV